MNEIQTFTLEDHGIRGALVRLEETWQRVVAAHDYPPEVRALLGESIVSTLLLATGRGQGKALDADIREAITAYVRREVEAGRIRDQAGVVRYLKKAGYEITRAGENYVTVLHPETKKRLRLKADSIAGMASMLVKRQRPACSIASPTPNEPPTWRQH